MRQCYWKKIFKLSTRRWLHRALKYKEHIIYIKQNLDIKTENCNSVVLTIMLANTKLTVDSCVFVMRFICI